MKKIYREYPRLLKCIEYINLYNRNSNAYHNNYHLIQVYKTCIELSNIYNCSLREELLTAALFHDVGHVGQMGVDDSINVKSAIEHFKGFAKDKYEPKFINDTINIILATKYPSDITDMTIEQKIISDADLSILFGESEDVFLVILGQLKQEFGKMSLVEFLDMEFNFYNNLEFKLGYCQNKWMEVKEHRLEELITYKNNII